MITTLELQALDFNLNFYSLHFVPNYLVIFPGFLELKFKAGIYIYIYNDMIHIQFCDYTCYRNHNKLLLLISLRKLR